MNRQFCFLLTSKHEHMKNLTMNHSMSWALGSSYDSITRASGSSMGREELRIKRQPWVFVEHGGCLKLDGFAVCHGFPLIGSRIGGG